MIFSSKNKFLHNLANLDKSRRKEFIKIQQKQNIGLIINFDDLQDKDNIEDIKTILRKNEHNVDVLTFFTTKKNLTPEQKISLLDKKFFEQSFVKDFISKQHDVLMIYSKQESLLLHQLITLSNAKFKVSQQYKTANFADMTFILGENFSLTSFFKTVCDYLCENRK